VSKRKLTEEKWLERKLRVINFAFLQRKDGTRKALISEAGDALVLLQVFNVLGKKWRSVFRLFFEDKSKIDFVYKMYYPIYMIKEGDAVVAVDAMMLHSYRISEYLGGSEDYQLYALKTYELPLIGDSKCMSLSEWNVAAYDMEIKDGLALWPALDESKAKNVADGLYNIYLKTKNSALNLRKNIDEMERKYKSDTEPLASEYGLLQKDYEEKIAQKNQEIENLVANVEKSVIKEFRTELEKKMDSLKNERDFIERTLKDVRSNSAEIEKAISKAYEERERAKNEIAKLENAIVSMGSKKGKIESDTDKLLEIKNIVMEREAMKKEKDRLTERVFTLIEEISDLKEKQSKVNKKIRLFETDLSKIIEKEKLLPSNEDLERKKIEECFLKRREFVIKELDDLIAKKERALLELKTKMNEKRMAYVRQKALLEDVYRKAEEELGKYKELFMKADTVQGEIEVIYVPFYLVSRDQKMSIIEPPIVLKENGKEVRCDKINVTDQVVSYIEGNWDNIAVILFESRELFDILNSKNRDRLKNGIAVLRNMGAVNKVQLSIITNGGLS